jgi:ribosomal protein S18 acetylase RimI-like enzyme
MMALESQAAQAASQFNQDWIVRLATYGDEEAIRAVALFTWDVTYAKTVRPINRERVIKQSYAPESLRRAFGRNGKNLWFWVCQEKKTKQVVGFSEIVLWNGVPPMAELTRIYILPQYQQHGIGAAFIDQAVSTLKALTGELRPPRLVLSVERHNATAIKFYEARGFYQTKEFIIPLVGQMLEMKEYMLDL